MYHNELNYNRNNVQCNLYNTIWNHNNNGDNIGPSFNENSSMSLSSYRRYRGNNGNDWSTQQTEYSNNQPQFRNDESDVNYGNNRGQIGNNGTLDWGNNLQQSWGTQQIDYWNNQGQLRNDGPIENCGNNRHQFGNNGTMDWGNNYQQFWSTQQIEHWNNEAQFRNDEPIDNFCNNRHQFGNKFRNDESAVNYGKNRGQIGNNGTMDWGNNQQQLWGNRQIKYSNNQNQFISDGPKENCGNNRHQFGNSRPNRYCDNNQQQFCNDEHNAFHQSNRQQGNSQRQNSKPIIFGRVTKDTTSNRIFQENDRFTLKTKSKSLVDKFNRSSKTAVQSKPILLEQSVKVDKNKPETSHRPEVSIKCKRNTKTQLQAEIRIKNARAGMAVLLSCIEEFEEKLNDCELNPATAEQEITHPQSAIKIELNSPHTVKKSELHPSLSHHLDEKKLQLLAVLYREEIQSLQESLSLPMPTPKLMVANIQLSNNEPITQHVYELIHAILVCWIDKYQHEQCVTPIFHKITNHSSHITIVCENVFAFECVQKCIQELSAQRLLSTDITSEHPPDISKQVNCYEAVYAGIVIEPQQFIEQLKLHWPRLRANQWIVVSHNMCLARNETKFLLLIDEFSAMELQCHHNNKLLVCLHAVEFTNKGHLPLNTN